MITNTLLALTYCFTITVLHCTNMIAFSSFLTLSDNQSMLFGQLKNTSKMWDNMLLKSSVTSSN